MIERIPVFRYNDPMAFRLSQHRLIREVLGATAGMGVATAIYVIIQQFSTVTMSKAVLVSPDVVSQTAEQFRVNDKTLDDTEMRRIAMHAREIAAALDGQQAGSSASSAVSEAASSSAVAGRPISTDEVTQGERVQFRNDIAQALRTGDTPPEPPSHAPTVSSSAASSASTSSAKTSSVRSSVASSVTSSVAAATNSQIEPVTLSKKPQGLPSSGLGLQILVLTALLLAAASTRGDLRQRLIAAARGAH
jgi:hypothetical protein